MASKLQFGFAYIAVKNGNTSDTNLNLKLT